MVMHGCCWDRSMSPCRQRLSVQTSEAQTDLPCPRDHNGWTTRLAMRCSSGSRSSITTCRRHEARDKPQQWVFTVRSRHPNTSSSVPLSWCGLWIWRHVCWPGTLQRKVNLIENHVDYALCWTKQQCYLWRLVLLHTKIDETACCWVWPEQSETNSVQTSSFKHNFLVWLIDSGMPRHLTVEQKLWLTVARFARYDDHRCQGLKQQILLAVMSLWMSHLNGSRQLHQWSELARSLYCPWNLKHSDSFRMNVVVIRLQQLRFVEFAINSWSSRPRCWTSSMYQRVDVKML